MTLLRNAYEKLAGIQVLFDSYKSFLPETFRGRCNIIPNPVPQFSESELVNHKISKEKYKITNIASLVTDCKQQHLAIDAFASVSEKFPNWELHFWGEGNDFDFLNNKIKRLNLEHKIFLNGFTGDPISKLKDADIFIFPSKYEGFPLALTEAMAVGLPCLALSSCSGVNELISNNKNGCLVTEEELSQSLEKLMESPDLRATLGKYACSEMKKFNPEEVLTKWSQFLQQVVD
ncbi:glycosyltransferase [Chryseobacterium taichungense]|uniref:glycosyltransferase n=1 Tax=Chryseobacterium taichungense TaxID=295069 RepID=UPI0028AD9B9A|nr:glycosyltransferase [Chryseobacterium taichungense]